MVLLIARVELHDQSFESFHILLVRQTRFHVRKIWVSILFSFVASFVKIVLYSDNKPYVRMVVMALSR